MNWYLSKIVFRIICGDGDHTAQFDEQLRLITASSKEEAFHKAQVLGVKEEDIFYNNEKQLVQWKFISLSELYLLSELIDGAAIYSRIDEKDNADAYLQMIYKKAELIRFGTSHELLKLA